jgi:hypothetical protein
MLPGMPERDNIIFLCYYLNNFFLIIKNIGNATTIMIIIIKRLTVKATKVKISFHSPIIIINAITKAITQDIIDLSMVFLKIIYNMSSFIFSNIIKFNKIL